jgi:hypothetical protein
MIFCYHWNCTALELENNILYSQYLQYSSISVANPECHFIFTNIPIPAHSLHSTHSFTLCWQYIAFIITALQFLKSRSRIMSIQFTKHVLLTTPHHLTHDNQGLAISLTSSFGFLTFFLILNTLLLNPDILIRKKILKNHYCSKTRRLHTCYIFCSQFNHRANFPISDRADTLQNNPTQ